MVNPDQSLSDYLSSVPQSTLQREYALLFGEKDKNLSTGDMGVHVPVTSSIRLTDLVLNTN